MHSKGIYHRDLDPQCLMVSEDGNLLVGDLGTDGDAGDQTDLSGGECLQNIDI